MTARSRRPPPRHPSLVRRRIKLAIENATLSPPPAVAPPQLSPSASLRPAAEERTWPRGSSIATGGERQGCAHDGELPGVPGDVGVVEVDFSDSKIHVGRHPLRLTLSFLSPGPPRLLCRHTARRATDRPASGRSRMRRRSAACSTCVARLGNGNPPGRWDGELWWRHRCLELAAKLFAIDAGLKGGMVLFSVLSSAVAAPQIKCRSYDEPGGRGVARCQGDRRNVL